MRSRAAPRGPGQFTRSRWRYTAGYIPGPVAMREGIGHVLAEDERRWRSGVDVTQGGWETRRVVCSSPRTPTYASCFGGPSGQCICLESTGWWSAGSWEASHSKAKQRVVEIRLRHGPRTAIRQNRIDSSISRPGCFSATTIPSGMVRCAGWQQETAFPRQGGSRENHAGRLQKMTPVIESPWTEMLGMQVMNVFQGPLKATFHPWSGFFATTQRRRTRLLRRSRSLRQ